MCGPLKSQGVGCSASMIGSLFFLHTHAGELQTQSGLGSALGGGGRWSTANCCFMQFKRVGLESGQSSACEAGTSQLDGELLGIRVLLGRAGSENCSLNLEQRGNSPGSLSLGAERQYVLGNVVWSIKENANLRHLQCSSLIKATKCPDSLEQPRLGQSHPGVLMQFKKGDFSSVHHSCLGGKKTT